MSNFIEHSKDPVGTAAITEHFAGRNQGQRPGADPMLKRTPGGTQAWNTPNPSSAAEDGLQNQTRPNVPTDNSLFNAPGQNLPRETGVNYKPAANAGHRTAQDPFQLADGFPGD